MSVQRRCDFTKASDGKWYMTLGDDEHSYEDHECTTYGPASSQEVLIKFLDENFSNPGGWSTDDSGKAPPPEKPKAPRRHGGLGLGSYGSMYDRRPWRP